jgi:hypothetical protein
VHPAVAAVIKRTLTHSPDGRYATAAELQQALEEAMIQAGLVTPTATVAAWLADVVGDRAEKRQDAISLGLSAAEQREKVADLMRSNADQTGGHSEPSSRLMTAVLGPDSQSPGGETLGSATMAIPMGHRRRGIAVAVIACLVVLGAAVMILVAGSSSSRRSAAVAPPPPSVEPLAPAIPPPPPPPTPPPPSATESQPSASASAAPSESAAHAGAPAVAPPPAGPRWILAPTGASKPRIVKPARVNDGF